MARQKKEPVYVQQNGESYRLVRNRLIDGDTSQVLEPEGDVLFQVPLHEVRRLIDTYGEGDLQGLERKHQRAIKATRSRGVWSR